MKKITLLLAMLISSFAVTAQVTNVSFESSEGYSAGPTIDGQNGWVVQDPLDPQFTISDVLASDGTNSFFAQATNEQYTNDQGQVVSVGALSPEYTFTSQTIEVSLDIYITTPTTAGNGSDVRIGVQAPSQEQVTSILIFDFENNINIADDTGSGPAFQTEISTYQFDTWYNLTMLYDFANSEILYYIDDSLIYTGSVWAADAIEQFTFFFDNYESSFYIDNVTVDENPLSIQDNQLTSFTHFYNDGQLGLEASQNIDNVSIYNMLGQEMMNTKLSNNNESINVSSFSNGMYITKVTIGDKTETFKFIKK